jgi:hypothetical protein
MHGPDTHDTGPTPLPAPEDLRRGVLAGAAGGKAIILASRERPKTGEAKLEALLRLRDEMIDCSADPSGTDFDRPEDPSTADRGNYYKYMSSGVRDGIAALDREYDLTPDRTRAMEKKGMTKEEIKEEGARLQAKKWKGATPLTHADSTIRWLRRKRNFDTPMLDSDGNQIYGRRVGFLAVERYETPVVYCSDGKLRMLINITGTPRPKDLKYNGHKLHREHDYDGPYAGQTFTGYCRLPDPDIAMPMRGRGQLHLVVHRHNQSKTLREELGLPRR